MHIFTQPENILTTEQMSLYPELDCYKECTAVDFQQPQPSFLLHWLPVEITIEKNVTEPNKLIEGVLHWITGYVSSFKQSSFGLQQH